MIRLPSKTLLSIVAIFFGVQCAHASETKRIYAQALVDQILTEHPELLVIGMHATAPGETVNKMIATNLDRIGKVSDDDDLKVFSTGEPIAEPAKGRFESLVAMKTASGKVIGAIGIVFMWKDGTDTSGFLPAANAIRDELASKIPSVESLFEPAAEDGMLLHPGPTMEIPYATGKFDFLEIDGARRRLLAAHEKSGTADFFDLKTYQLLARVETGPAVDIAPDPVSGSYFVSASEQKKVVVVDGDAFKVLKEIPMDGELDALLFDPANRRVYVTNDEGSHVWSIDADSGKVASTIDIPGAPEYMLYDSKADRIYLNIKGTNEIVVIDPSKDTIVAHWPTAPATKPHGLAFDPKSGWLFSAGTNGMLAAIDSGTGKSVGSCEIAKAVDQATFDPYTGRVYCACTDQMSVVQETADGVKFLGNVASAKTAKNVAVDPTTHWVWTTFTDGANSYVKSWRP
jgi:DNA-binding beta-propeller fold protein YncE